MSTIEQLQKLVLPKLPIASPRLDEAQAKAFLTAPNSPIKKRRNSYIRNNNSSLPTVQTSKPNFQN